MSPAPFIVHRLLIKQQTQRVTHPESGGGAGYADKAAFVVRASHIKMQPGYIRVYNIIIVIRAKFSVIFETIIAKNSDLIPNARAALMFDVPWCGVRQNAGELEEYNLFRWIYLLCLLMLLPGISTALAGDIDSELTAARHLFLQGVDGDKRVVRKATLRFGALIASYPREPVFLAYHGACITLQGRDAPNNLDKQRLTEEGLGEIDRALDMLKASADQGSPHYLDTLLVAANSYIHIPAFFDRNDKGKRLLQEILAHPAFNGMAAGYKAATYLAAALVAHGEGDDNAYRDYLNQTVNTDPEGRDGRIASKLLKKL